MRHRQSFVRGNLSTTSRKLTLLSGRRLEQCLRRRQGASSRMGHAVCKTTVKTAIVTTKGGAFMTTATSGRRFLRTASVLCAIWVVVAFGPPIWGQSYPKPLPCGSPYKVTTLAKKLSNCDFRNPTCASTWSRSCSGSCWTCDKTLKTRDFTEDAKSTDYYLLRDADCLGTTSGNCIDLDPDWWTTNCVCTYIIGKPPAPNDCGKYEEADPATNCNPPKI